MNNALKLTPFQKTISIEYVDGLCGSGKTYTLAGYIKSNVYICTKYMIITPSKELANQIYKQLDNDFNIPNVHLIHSDNTQKVGSRILTTIQEIDSNDAGVLICTQEAFYRIPFFQNKDTWTIFVDEIPKIDNFYCPSLPYNHEIITKFIEIEEQVTPRLYRMKLTDETITSYQSVAKQKIKVSARQFVNRSIDDVDALIKPIILNILQEHECFVEKKNWDKIVIRNEVTSDKTVDMTYGNSSNMLYFLTVLTPNVFAGFTKVIMMGANFSDSILCKYWQEYHHVTFAECKQISSKLRYSAYENGSRLTVTYLQEENWSKYSRDKFINDISRESLYINQVNDAMQGKEFIYMTNNDSTTSHAINGTKAPVISHGMNKFDSYDNIYFSPALNRQPMHTKMLNDLGIDTIFINRASIHEIAHQGIMRTSMRNPTATNSVNAVVVDKATAEAIARLFPECSIKAIDGVLRKVAALTPVERNNKSKLKKMLEHLDLNSSLRTATAANETPYIQETASAVDSGVLVTKYINNEKRNQNPRNDSFDDIDISILNSIFTKNISSFNGAPLELIKALKQLWTKNCITSKDEVTLFNGTLFKDDEERTLANAVFSNFVTVDIDNGDLSPEEFKKIFQKEHKQSMVMMNSFSRSVDRPNNYRAIFFIKDKVNDSTYRQLHKYLQGILKDRGYITATKAQREKILLKNPDARFSGIDLTKTHLASFFYLPCKVISRTDFAFFWRVNVHDNEELIRYAIDPVKVLQYAPEKTELSTLVYEAEDIPTKQKTSLDDIKQKLLSGNYRHLGTHDNYGKLAAAMRHSGYSLWDFIEVTPVVSYSKTTKDAEIFWDSWNKYEDITEGSLRYMVR